MATHKQIMNLVAWKDGLGSVFINYNRVNLNFANGGIASLSRQEWADLIAIVRSPSEYIELSIECDDSCHYRRTGYEGGDLGEKLGEFTEKCSDCKGTGKIMVLAARETVEAKYPQEEKV